MRTQRGQRKSEERWLRRDQRGWWAATSAAWCPPSPRGKQVRSRLCGLGRSQASAGFAGIVHWALLSWAGMATWLKIRNPRTFLAWADTRVLLPPAHQQGSWGNITRLACPEVPPRDMKIQISPVADKVEARKGPSSLVQAH